MIPPTNPTSYTTKPGSTSVKLGEVLGEDCFQNGLYKHADSYGTGAPILRINDFDNAGRLLTEIFSRVSLSPEEYQQFAIRAGDVLVNRVNSLSHVGKSMLVPSMKEYPVFESNMMRIRIESDNPLTPEYVAAVLQGEDARRHFRRVAKPAVAQASINQEDVRSVVIALCPKPVQRRIAEALAVWDAAIEKTEQLIAAKGQRNEALSNQLLFGKLRLERRDAHTTKALHWFSMPSDWRIVEIGQIASEVSATNGSDDDPPVLSCTKYDGLVDSLKYFDKQVFSHDTSKYKIVRRGQFAYATNHIEEGSIGYQNFVPAGLVSPIYTVFQADATKVDDGYLYKLLKTERLRQLFAANTNASVDRRGSLRWKEFARIHIPLPPLGEQQKISAILDEAKREVSLLQAQAEGLRTQKRGLMQKLLTGQWRVKTEEEEVPA